MVADGATSAFVLCAHHSLLICRVFRCVTPFWFDSSLSSIDGCRWCDVRVRRRRCLRVDPFGLDVAVSVTSASLSSTLFRRRRRRYQCRRLPVDIVAVATVVAPPTKRSKNDGSIEHVPDASSPSFANVLSVGIVVIVAISPRHLTREEKTNLDQRETLPKRAMNSAHRRCERGRNRASLR